MRWLVDGYNVIRRDPDLRGREAESLEAGRTALVHLLAAAARSSQDDFTVVFDGARVTGGSPPAGRVQVLFSRPPRTADDELMRLGRQHGAGAAVVTSDRKIQDAARRAGCPVVTAEQFLRGLSGESEPHRTDPAKKDEGDDRPREKRGNPRRLSKKARATARALRRLRRP
jgi:predicted RNA-binding protein with PIN domain